VSFRFLEFWARPTYQLGSSRLLRRNEVHRLFKWGPGYRYVTHQPPIIHDEQGRDLRKLQWVRPDTTDRMGIRMYHYSHLLPSQMEQKAHVYLGQEPVQFSEALRWFQDSFVTLRRPYRVERHYYWPSWLERYEGAHPPEIDHMMGDIAAGRLNVTLRPVDDAERLLDSHSYPLGAQALRAYEPLHQAWRFGLPPVKNALHGKLPKSIQRLRQPAGGEPQPGAASPGPTSDAQAAAPAPHVVFLAPFFEVPNGMAATNRLLLLARALQHAGGRPLILSVLPSGRGPDAANAVTAGHADGVPYEYISGSPVKATTFARRRLDEARAWPKALARLLALRRQGRLDAVYLWPRSMSWTWTRPLLMAMAKAAGAPVVLESNERPWSLRERPSGVERKVSPLQGVDGVVCISGLLADWSRSEAARLGLRTRVLQVPILVDCDEQSVGAYPPGPPVLVFAASPAYRTTAEFILDAMALVWRDHPDCRLVMTGVSPDGKHGGWLGERRAAGRLDARVELPGRVPREQLLAFYQSAHALLVPLFDDVQSAARFPTKIGEYLAAGRPIVTTPVGEIPHHFTDLDNAFVAADTDPAAYAAAISRVLQDGARAVRAGRAGRAFCETAFDYRRHGASLAEFISGLSSDDERRERREEETAR
jgi:glycosyltransferase involved in cell wall biosynthesis